MISFVIPAHNEEALLGRAIASIHESSKAAGEPYEVIVVNDASTDGTAGVAVQYGAVLVHVELRRISAVRNAGARHAKGDVLIFVDADTVLPAPTLRAALAILQAGGIGGGASVAWDEICPFWGKLLLRVWNEIARAIRWAAGCFVFVRRDAFEAVGGFDETYYVGEEIILSSALKRKGRFVVLRQPVITSARKVHLYGKFEMMWLMARMSIQGRQSWRQRDGLDMWYARRDQGPDTLTGNKK